MKTNDFDELIASVSEAGKIKRGQLSPSRRFTFTPMGIKKIRRTLIASFPSSTCQYLCLVGISPLSPLPRVRPAPITETNNGNSLGLS